jgi:hypothetical protein
MLFCPRGLEAIDAPVDTFTNRMRTKDGMRATNLLMPICFSVRASASRHVSLETNFRPF